MAGKGLALREPKGKALKSQNLCKAKLKPVKTANKTSL
mgnify:CR=1 FL=1